MLWVRVLDVLRLAVTAEGRARLLTLLLYRDEVHQTTPYTAEDRYPELFDFVAHIAPGARRISLVRLLDRRRAFGPPCPFPRRGNRGRRDQS